MKRKWPSFLHRAWRGEASFWSVYWNAGIFGGVVAVAVGTELLPAIHDSLPLQLLGLVATGCYLAWAGALMWRCAANVSGLWVYVAPFFGFAWFTAGVVLFALAVWLGLAGLGLPVGLESPD